MRKAHQKKTRRPNIRHSLARVLAEEARKVSGGAMNPWTCNIWSEKRDGNDDVWTNYHQE